MSITNISRSDCEKLSLKIKNDVFKPANTYKTTIFLCGADISLKDKLRSQISEELKQGKHSHLYDIIFPEDIFEELLSGFQGLDLLSLQNLLAESVDAIVLIPESPGSFTELGAFANDKKLRQKIICVIDKNFKKYKSFINQGPVKLIKRENKSGVIFLDTTDILKGIDQLRSSLAKIKKTSSKLKDKISLLQMDNYLLSSIYLLDPVNKQTLITLVEFAIEDVKHSFQVTTIALTMLTKKRQVELTPEGYKLTPFGVKNFLISSKKRIENQDETVGLDDLRLEILNLKLRNKKLKI